MPPLPGLPPSLPGLWLLQPSSLTVPCCHIRRVQGDMSLMLPQP